IQETLEGFSDFRDSISNHMNVFNHSVNMFICDVNKVEQIVRTP
ncbi:17239_t:CDS:1, partial [Dentiscutata erythropus]